mmetsp:Transcript_125727/g.402412  ORF Transcript_125727/g.402412 Transcript_125727/m.402412 type:complete len:808 (-) Transcript_125727:106-2529(-)
MVDLVIDALDEDLCREDFLLSVRFGQTRRQVVASKAIGEFLHFPKLPDGKVHHTVRVDLLTHTGTAWLVLRPGADRYELTFSGDSLKGQKGLTVRANPPAEKVETRSPSKRRVKEGGGLVGLDEAASASLAQHADKHRHVADDAQEYLDKFQVIGFMHALLHTVIRERPADPYLFMAMQLPRTGREPGERPRTREKCERKEQLRVRNEALETEVEELKSEVAALRRSNRELQARLKDAFDLAETSPTTTAGGSSPGMTRATTASSSSDRRPSTSDLLSMSPGGRRSLSRAPTCLLAGRRRPVMLLDTLRGSASAGLLPDLLPLRKDQSRPSLMNPDLHMLPSPKNKALHGIVTFSDAGARRADDGTISEGLAKFWARLRGEADQSDEFRVLRQSVTTGRWTLYTAGGNFKKPSQFSYQRRAPRLTELPTTEPRCPFCVGNEHKTPDPLLCFDENGEETEPGVLAKGWCVRVIPNIFPLLVTPKGLYGEAFRKKLEHIPHSSVALGNHQNGILQEALDDEDEKGTPEGDKSRELYRQINACGYSEVVVENPIHNGLLAIVDHTQVALALRALQSRGRVLVQQPGVRQLLYFKQYGALSGGSLVHPHMQVVTLPLLTPEMQNRLKRATTFYDNHGCCSICQSNIFEPLGTGAHASRLVYQSDNFVAAVPFASNQYRVSICPIQHNHSWLSISLEEVNELAWLLQLVMEGIYKSLDDPEYNIYIVSADKPSEVAGSEEAVHWVMEVHPRFPAELGGMELASGIRVISGLPEDFAQQLRTDLLNILEARQAVGRMEPRFSPRHGYELAAPT